MKKLLLSLFLFLFWVSSMAQCPFQNNPTFVVSNPMNVSGLTLGNRTYLYETMWAGEYFEINSVIAGATYRFDMCDATEDTYLTLFNSSNTAIAFNDDFCGIRSQIEYTFPTTGIFRIQVNKKIGADNCTTDATNKPLHITLVSAPVVAASISSITRASSSPTNSNSVNFTVTFSAAVSGLTTSNFNLTTNGVSGASVTSVSGSGTTWTVTVNTGTGNGDIRLNLINDTGLTPNLSNEPFTTGETYTIDKSPPTISITSTATSPTKNSPIPITFSSNENINGFIDTDVSVTNGILGGFTGSGSNYSANITPSANGVVSVSINSSTFTDLAGNTNNTGASFDITYDNIAPTVTSIVRNTPNSPITNATSVVFGVTFSETVSGVDASDFSLNTTGSAIGTISAVNLQSGVYLVTVNSISGNGTIRLDLKNSGTAITDAAINAISGGFTSGEIYTINQTPNFVLSSPQSLTICENSAAQGLNSILRISDLDVGQNLTWSVVTNPLNGTLGGFNHSTTSNGGTITPAGLTYTSNTNFSGNDSFTIRVSDGVSTVDMAVNLTVTSLPSISINSNLVLCQGETINLTSSGGGDYLWSGPNSFSSSLQNPTITNATSSDSGIYTLTVTSNGCSASATTSVVVNTQPSATISGNQILCEGQPLNLTSSFVGSNSWVGPNGFNSLLQNPSISNITQSNAGVYTLTISASGCSATYTTSLSVNVSPTVTVNGHQTVCQGETISFTSSGGGDYLWSGPNSFSSSLQNPTINNSIISNSGTYTLTITDNGCSVSTTTSVTVSALPSATISGNQALCEGQTLNLTSSFVGSNSWKGPNGFNSFLQNPSISNITLDNAGTYTLTITENGCLSTLTTSVNVNIIPTISVNTTQTLCEGQTISLTSSGGGNYFWSGPNSFSSSIQNPTILNSTVNNSGIYSITITTNGCSSSTTTQVTINPLPIVTIDSEIDICEGQNIDLTSSGGGDYLWSGPNGFSSTLQNPTINNATSANAGIYSLAITVSGCSSSQTALVTVNAIPQNPIVQNETVCPGANVTLTATCNGGATPVWYSDALGNNTTSPILNNVSTNQTYYVACESNNCKSGLINQQVIISQAIPYTYSTDIEDLVFGCISQSTLIPLTINNSLGLSVQWQINTGSGFSNLSNSAIYEGVDNDTLKVNNLTQSMNNYLYRALISSSCNTIESDTFKLAINALPNINTNPIGQNVCFGNRTTLSIQANGAGISYRWQVNSGSGFENLDNDQNYENVTTPQLTIKNIPSSFNNYLYRCEVYNSCTSVFSNAATLQVDATVTILAQPSNRIVCQNNLTHFSVSAVHISGGNITYQWQISYNGTTYSNLSNSATYQGVTTSSLTVSNIQMGLNNAKYRCLLNGYCQTADATINVIPVVTITSNPANVTICQGNFASFTVGAAGQGLSYRWQVNSGSGFVNILDGDFYYQGATEPTLRLYSALASMNNYQYRCVVSGTSTCDFTVKESSAATLNISTSAEAQTIVAATQISSGNVIYQATEYVLGINKVISPAKAEYRAGNAILLNPGFEVSAGGIFTAKIQNPCNLANLTNQVLPKTITK